MRFHGRRSAARLQLSLRLGHQRGVVDGRLDRASTARSTTRRTTSYAEFSQSWTVGHSWTERVGSYTEWFVLVPISADTNRTENYFNGGFTVLINNDVQWDIRAGVGLNDAADDFFAGTGLSLRYW